MPVNDPYGRQQIFKQLRDLGAQSRNPNGTQQQSWDTGEAPDPMMSTMPAYRAQRPATQYGDENPETGASVVPGAEEMPYVAEAPGSGQRGSTENGTWDAVTDRVPIYEYNGQRIVSELQWLPSWPQDLQPVDWVDVPRSGTEWRVS